MMNMDAMAAAQSEEGQRAIFTLSKPLKMPVNGTEMTVNGIDMRQVASADLPLLDRFHGQPIALAQNMVSALCDLTLEQVRSLDLADFTMLADEALWQVSLVAEQMGLAADHFVKLPAP